MSEGAQLSLVQENALAIGIQVSAAVGDKRQVTMTAGVPMDWSKQEIALALDKIAEAMDHLKARWTLETLEQELEMTLRQLETADWQKDQHATQVHNAWVSKGKKGPVQLDGQQKAQMDNFEKSREHLVKHIAKMRGDIEKLKAA